MINLIFYELLKLVSFNISKEKNDVICTKEESKINKGTLFFHAVLWCQISVNQPEAKLVFIYLLGGEKGKQFLKRNPGQNISVTLFSAYLGI